MLDIVTGAQKSNDFLARLKVGKVCMLYVSHTYRPSLCLSVWFSLSALSLSLSLLSLSLSLSLSALSLSLSLSSFFSFNPLSCPPLFR